MDANEFNVLMTGILRMKPKHNHSNVVIRFKKNIEMRWIGRKLVRDYFGEWSEIFDRPHGRGVWFG